MAEALRAHAARTPLPEPEQVDATADPTGAPPGGYGPLAGGATPSVGASVPADPPTARTPSYPLIHPAALPIAALPIAPPDQTDRLEPASRVAVGWVVLLAVLLGLASGAVVGLLTFL